MHNKYVRFWFCICLSSWNIWKYAKSIIYIKHKYYPSPSEMPAGKKIEENRHSYSLQHSSFVLKLSYVCLFVALVRSRYFACSQHLLHKKNKLFQFLKLQRNVIIVKMNWNGLESYTTSIESQPKTVCLVVVILNYFHSLFCEIAIKI